MRVYCCDDKHKDTIEGRVLELNLLHRKCLLGENTNVDKAQLTSGFIIHIYTVSQVCVILACLKSIMYNVIASICKLIWKKMSNLTLFILLL